MCPLDLFWQRCEGPIVYGVNDCCMTVADVIVAAGGPDLMAGYRGRYRTRLGFVKAFRKAGFSALDEAIASRFAAYGKESDQPADFDVALVAYLDNGSGMTSPGFYHSGYWFLRSERGGLCTHVQTQQQWRVI